MSTVNLLDPETNLSELVDAVESGAETEIIIARNGRPAAKLVAIPPKRLGLLEGKYPDFTLEDLNSADAEIQKMFEEGEIFPTNNE